MMQTSDARQSANGVKRQATRPALTITAMSTEEANGERRGVVSSRGERLPDENRKDLSDDGLRIWNKWRKFQEFVSEELTQQDMKVFVYPYRSPAGGCG